jgi:hypothetical protein
MKFTHLIAGMGLALGLFASSRVYAADTSAPPKLDCKLVSPTDKTRDYITQFYLTSWASASFEGATQGFSEGLGQGNVGEAIRNAMIRPQKTVQAIFNELPTSIKPHCRVFATDRLAVAQALASIMPQLGNVVLTSDIRTGIFKTDVIDREHWRAKWKDSYIITVTDEGEDQVRVRVLRTIYISRDQGVTYNQGISDGHNEKWILAQIAARMH